MIRRCLVAVALLGLAPGCETEPPEPMPATKTLAEPPLYARWHLRLDKAMYRPLLGLGGHVFVNLVRDAPLRPFAEVGRQPAPELGLALDSLQRLYSREPAGFAPYTLVDTVRALGRVDGRALYVAETLTWLGGPPGTGREGRRATPDVAGSVVVERRGSRARSVLVAEMNGNGIGRPDVSLVGAPFGPVLQLDVGMGGSGQYTDQWFWTHEPDGWRPLVESDSVQARFERFVRDHTNLPKGSYLDLERMERAVGGFARDTGEWSVGAQPLRREGSELVAAGPPTWTPIDRDPR